MGNGLYLSKKVRIYLPENKFYVNFVAKPIYEYFKTTQL